MKQCDRRIIYKSHKVCNFTKRTCRPFHINMYSQYDKQLLQ
uniref:Uncharacterized protein n=1 Tax=Anguilla anguilla TaxID=7936 RepID=A0A0E9R8R3_ANGAN